MNIFLIANPKGGSGKSTLAANLAGYFASKGQKVMLGDIDRQQSSRDWLSLRPADAPLIKTWDISHDNIARPPKGTTHVVLDTPAGLRGKALDKVLKISTHVIIPVQPSLFDMLAALNFIHALEEEKTVRKGKVEVAVVGMRVDARTKSAAELEHFFSSLDLPILSYLRDTQTYVHAIAAGLTIFDMPPASCERDLEQWQPIISWAENPKKAS